MIYQGANDLQKLKEFIKPLMIQTIFEFSYERMDTIFGGVKPALVMFIDKEQHTYAKFMDVYKRASH